MTQTVLSADEFSAQLEQYRAASADDMRKVIVGLQDESHAADIYQEWAHLYTPGQLDSLAQQRAEADDEGRRDRLHRLWHATADGLAAGEVIQAAQDLINDRLAWRAELDGDELSFNHLVALLSSEPDFDRRERIYDLTCQADREFAERELELAVRSQELRTGVYGLDGEIAIAEDRMGVDVHAFERQIREVADATAESFEERTARIYPMLLGREVERPSRAHAHYMRSLPTYDTTYVKDRMPEVCSATLADLGFDLAEIPTIHADLEDRPEKDPRACVIAVRVPHEVHLVVRPTGGITDYQAFMHEAGHALHYGLAAAELPFEWRDLSPDHALTEIYSYVVERILHNPEWHIRHFGLSDDEAARRVRHIRFVDAMLFRRYAAKLRYELEFWKDPSAPGLPGRYKELLDSYTLNDYSTASFAADIDPGLYAADYLRAWRTSEQVIQYLEREFGTTWFANPAAGEWLRELFARGTRPTNEQIAELVGGGADDFSALTTTLAG